MTKTITRRTQTDAVLTLILCGKTAAVVLYLEHELLAARTRAHGDARGPRELCHAMANGVFGDRLKDEIGHERGLRGWIDVVFDAQPVLKASAFDLEIELEQTQLLGQLHLCLR